MIRVRRYVQDKKLNFSVFHAHSSQGDAHPAYPYDHFERKSSTSPPFFEMIQIQPQKPLGTSQRCGLIKLTPRKTRRTRP